MQITCWTMRSGAPLGSYDFIRKKKKKKVNAKISPVMCVGTHRTAVYAIKCSFTDSSLCWQPQLQLYHSTVPQRDTLCFLPLFFILNNYAKFERKKNNNNKIKGVSCYKMQSTRKFVSCLWTMIQDISGPYEKDTRHHSNRWISFRNMKKTW